MPFRCPSEQLELQKEMSWRCTFGGRKVETAMQAETWIKLPKVRVGSKKKKREAA